LYLAQFTLSILQRDYKSIVREELLQVYRAPESSPSEKSSLLSSSYIKVCCVAGFTLAESTYVHVRALLDERYAMNEMGRLNFAQEGPGCVWRLDFKPALACIQLSNIEFFSPAGRSDFFFFEAVSNRRVGPRATANEDFDTNRINQRGMKLIIAVVRMKLSIARLHFQRKIHNPQSNQYRYINSVMNFRYKKFFDGKTVICRNKM